MWLKLPYKTPTTINLIKFLAAENVNFKGFDKPRVVSAKTLSELLEPVHLNLDILLNWMQQEGPNSNKFSRFIALFADVFDGEDEPNISEMKDADGNTLLHIAVQHEYAPVIFPLIDNDSNVLKITNNAGETALETAIAGGNNYIVDTLQSAIEDDEGYYAQNLEL